MKLLAGLGNPGPDYERHRHNIGFRVLEEVARRARIDLGQEKFNARIGQGAIAGEKVLLLQPQTYMNLSGQAVAGAARFYKVPPSDILVIHDELDLPFGRLQLKNGGGHGGHNGLRSVTEQLGTDGYARLRFGIDKPQGPNAKERVVGYVLSGFHKEEEQQLPELVARAADAVECWVREGMAAAMNRFNRR
ncbi:MAG: aminoacyl-tRNA hydrolase [Myxococcaceae bacterium]|nr:aminoacyl-tRNA hydrolase [Myxococcaceae bacterium]